MDRRANEELPPVSSLRRWGATAPSPRLPLIRPHVDDFYEVREQAPEDQNEPRVSTFHPIVAAFEQAHRAWCVDHPLLGCKTAPHRSDDLLDTAKLATDESPSQCPVASAQICAAAVTWDGGGSGVFPRGQVPVRPFAIPAGRPGPQLRKKANRRKRGWWFVGDDQRRALGPAVSDLWPAVSLSPCALPRSRSRGIVRPGR